MSKLHNPYGDGKACERIVEFIAKLEGKTINTENSSLKANIKRMNKPEVVMIGLGYIGLPTAALIASNKVYVHGVDINPEVVETINKGANTYCRTRAGHSGR